MRKNNGEKPANKVSYGELEQRTRELSAFLAVTEVLATLPDLSDLDAVLGRALDKTLEIMGQDFGGIMLLDQTTGVLSTRVYRGFTGRHSATLRLKLGQGIAGQVAQTGESLSSEDFSADPRVVHRDEVAADKLRAFVSVALRTEGKILGTLNVASCSNRRFSAGEVRLLEGIGRQIAAAIENARLHQKARDDKVRQELLHETLSIQEEERRRIARELHDETSQALASLSANLEVAMRKLPAGTQDVKAMLKKAQGLSTSILEETHKLIYQLRPTLLDDLGLVAATRWLTESTLGAAGVNVDFRSVGREKRLPAKVETGLFRVIQEIVANITRHACAENVAIVLRFKPGKVAVRIVDDGCGFDVAEAVTSPERPRGLGLLGMRERIESIKGTFGIFSYPGGGGTTIDIDIPTKGESDGKN